VNSRAHPQSMTQRVLGGIGLALLIAAGIFAWDYWSSQLTAEQQMQAYGDHHHHGHGHGHHHDHGHDHHHSEFTATPENYQEVLAEIDRQLEADPGNKRLQGAKVHIAMEHDVAIAIRECESILRENPEDAFALTHLAYAYYDQGEMERAIHFGNAALEQYQTLGLFMLVGHAHFQRRDYARAKTVYERALALYPNSKQAKLGVTRSEEQMAAVH